MSDRPGFSFCVCPDSALIWQTIQRHLRSRSEKWQQKVFWADEDIPDIFWQNLTLSSLLEQPKAVILRKSEKASVSVWNNLSSILDRFRPNIWPFFCLENEWSRGKPAVPKVVTKQKCWQIANKKGWIWQSPGLTKAELHKRIEDWARRHAIIVPQEVVRVLLQVLPLDASSVDHELQKLQLLTGDTKQVCLRDLEIISCHNEMDIFQFLRALESPGRETELWTQIMRNQMASQNNWLLPFLALMLREIRLLWQLVSGEDNKVKLPSNIKREKMELAKRLGHARLVPVWTLLLEAETCLKTGERTPEQAFELLMSGLMQIFASRTSQMSQSFL